MGSPKQLLPFRGRSLIRFAAETALATQCRPVIVVLGSHAAEIAPVLADLDLQVVENRDWEGGMGSSIRAGVQAAGEQGCESVILALADQPFVSSGTLKRLIDAYEESAKPVVASQYAGTVGVPALFSRRFFSQLCSLGPSQGCKQLILSCPDESLLLACPEAEQDIDTPEDYRSAARLDS
jgi:molybdenum cofactor cytidylyltransferase